VGSMGPEPSGLLIDTSALVAHLRGQARIDGIVGRYPAVYVSAVTVEELEYGALRVGRASDLAGFEAGLALGSSPPREGGGAAGSRTERSAGVPGGGLGTGTRSSPVRPSVTGLTCSR
jgi:hypothetical protein